VTGLNVVPPLVLGLVKSPLCQKFTFPKVETLTVGAAPMGSELEDDFRKKYPHIKIAQGYGMTELPTCVVLNPKEAIRCGSVGLLLPNITAKVVNPLDGKTLLGPNKDGELWFKTPNMMTGYLHNKEATDATIDKDGFLHTGDIGHFDEDGYLYIVDRLKELIKYRGLQVAPAELEAHLQSHKAIADVAVVGKPDPASPGCELPTAFVVLKPGFEKTDPADIIAFNDSKVAPYKKLRGGVIYTNAIPRTATGKILRSNLRNMLPKPAKL